MKEIPLGWIKQPDGSYSKPRRVPVTFLTGAEPNQNASGVKSAGGKKSPAVRVKPASDAPNRYAEKFLAACAAAGLPAPVPEYPFAAPERRYRADFAFVEARVMVEIDGGVWRKGGGAHSHPLNIIRDMERTNEATVRGWRLLRFTPENLTKPETMATIQKAIAWKPA